jgi:uncharacterized MAPEG superfamily protein
MPAELTVLALGAVLLLVHVMLAGRYKTQQYGTAWNMGARDEDLPPLNPVAGRLARAQGNFQETFPLAIVALMGVVLAGKASDLTAIAAWVWLAARIVYLPLYWAGVPKWRTVVWGIGTLALLVALGVLLLG